MCKYFQIIFINILVCAGYYAQQVFYIDSIEIEGHKKTKRKIILREFIKKQGDTIHANRLVYVMNRTQQNIFNTNLFVFDTVYYRKIDSNRIVLHARVRERWYIWPVPIFEIQDRNFNTWWQTKDLFRINYGVIIDHENFTGQKDKFSLICQKGYAEKYGIVYRKPYINSRQTLGLRASLFFKQNNEAQYRTVYNQPMFYRNYHKHIIKLIEAKLSFSYRKKFFDNHTIELGYNDWYLDDTLIQLNPFIVEPMQTNNIRYMYLFYAYTFNNTDIQYYPLKGWVFSASVNKTGLGIQSIDNVDYVFAFVSLKKFTPIHSWLNLANGLYSKWTNTNNVSYFFNRSIGYGNNNVRGYEYYVVDGQQYVMSKNSLRFRIVKPRVYYLKWLKIPQFNIIPFYCYFNLFFDAAYVQDKLFYTNNFLNNRWIYGYGVGIDFISYYDLVLRVEWAINHLSQTGIYLHLNMGI